jgi:hypothetical protein
MLKQGCQWEITPEKKTKKEDRAMKIGMHVSVRESGARGVLVGLEGETASVRLREGGTREGALLTEVSTYDISALKGEKGRPVKLDRLAAADAAAVTGGEGTSSDETVAPAAE